MDEKLQFMEWKWTMWFRDLDVEGVGKISRTNAELVTQYFIEANDFNPKRKDEMTAILGTFWHVYILKYHETVPGGEITEQQFVRRLREHYQTNYGEFQAFFRRAFTLVFIAADINADGYMDYLELRGMSKSFKHDDDDVTKKIFDSYKPNADGAIPIQRVIDSWVDFVTGDDPAKFNPIIDLFKSEDRAKSVHLKLPALKLCIVTQYLTKYNYGKIMGI